MQLYRIQLKVRPAVKHPLYWDWEFGLLVLVLYADDPADAVRRSYQVASALPYEVEPGQSAQVDLLTTDRFGPLSEQLRKKALTTGVAAELVIHPIGEDKPDDWDD